MTRAIPRPDVLRYYDMWVQDTYITSRHMVRMRNESRSFGYRPLVSILLPVYNPERLWLERALDSVMAQPYKNWELCVCDDASTKEHVKEILGRYEKLDGRIKVKYLDENENICRATNHALSLATGEYIGLLDHDDELAADALYEMVKFLQDHRDADLIYSDEDKIDERGKRLIPHMKIGWSPDLALSANYLCHFSIYRKTLLDQLEGWREGYDGAQDLDLVLRFGEIAGKIYHIPKVLYHWRMVEGSTALSAEGKTYTHERAHQCVADAVERRGIPGKVEDGFFPNTFRVRREILGEPKVSIVIPVRGKPPLQRCVESLRENTGYPYELLLADTGDVEATTRKYMESSGYRIVRRSNSSLSELYNEAVEKTSGDYVVLLDPHVEATSSEWLENLLQHAQRAEVGAVGARLDYPNGDVYQAGLVLDSGDESRSPDGSPRFYRNADRQVLGWQAFIQLTRNCSALSSACMMFERGEFQKLGGFDAEHFPAEFADVDLCLRMRERDLLLVYTPYAGFRYHGKPHRHPSLDAGQTSHVRERWGSMLTEDPYYNPLLTWHPGDLRAIMGKPPVPHPAEVEEPEEEPSRPPEAETGASPAPPFQDSGVGRELGKISFPPPFFIVGHGRSGTTWLELSLNSHPEVLCKGSGMFFGRDMDLFDTQRTLPVALANTEDLNTWHDMRPNYWSERSFEEDLPGMVKALADHTMGAALQQTGKSIVGDRTPHYVAYLEELHELYPDAKVIHIIRDGRDVAVSNQHAVWQNARDKGGPVDLEPDSLRKRDAYLKDREAFVKNGESLFTEAGIEQLANSWAGMVRRGRRQGRKLFGENYLEVRYENLLDDPNAELKRVLGFLGADTDQSVVDRVAEENSFEKVTGRRSGQEDPSSFNRKGVSGEWREVFTDRDRRVFDETAGDLLKDLGYEEDGAPPKQPAKVSERPAPVMRSALTIPPFFAVGHGRSGTTWLERILNTHPEVLCKGSAMFFGKKRSLYEGRKTLYAALQSSEDLKLWHGMQANYWSERGYEEEVPGMVRALADHVMGTALAQSGKSIVGDRTPHYVSHLEEVRELYPRAKVIQIIRDGRDVAISNLHAVWNSARDRGGPVDLKPEDLERRDAYLEDPEGYLKSGQSIFSEFRIDALAQSWAEVVGKGREDGHSLFRDNYFELRYESLLEDPAPELEKLFGFLEVSQDRSILDRIAEENSFEKMAGRKPGEEKTTSFFRKGVSGDWKNVLNERDREVFKQHAGTLLIELGYERGLDW